MIANWSRSLRGSGVYLLYTRVNVIRSTAVTKDSVRIRKYILAFLATESMDKDRLRSVKHGVNTHYMQDPLHPSPSKGKISFTYFSKSLNQDYSSSTSFDLGLYVHMIFDLLIRSLIMECYTHFGHHPKLARQCSVTC
jgi:hypothetical protein